MESKTHKDITKIVDVVLYGNEKMMDHLSPALVKHSLTLSQFFLLNFLREINRPVAMNEIAPLMQHTTAATTGIIDRMQILGFVKRKLTRKDRRVMLVSITAKGTNILASLNIHMAQLFEHMLSLLTSEEKTHWIAVHQKILVEANQAAPKFDSVKKMLET